MTIILLHCLQKLHSIICHTQCDITFQDVTLYYNNLSHFCSYCEKTSAQTLYWNFMSKMKKAYFAKFKHWHCTEDFCNVTLVLYSITTSHWSHVIHLWHVIQYVICNSICYWIDWIGKLDIGKHMSNKKRKSSFCQPTWHNEFLRAVNYIYTKAII